MIKTRKGKQMQNLPTLAEYLADDEYSKWLDLAETKTVAELEAYAEDVAKWELSVSDEQLYDVHSWEADIQDLIEIKNGN